MNDQDQKWIAVYTRARSEKRVAFLIHERGLTSFVPLQHRLHKWSDRSKWVDEPLIPSYVFVLLSPFEHHLLFDIPALVRVVMFNGRVAVIRPEEIGLLRKTEAHRHVKAVAVDQIARGERVEIVGGVFAGHSGVVVRGEKGLRIAVSIEELSYAVIVTVQPADLKVR